MPRSERDSEQLVKTERFVKRHFPDLTSIQACLYFIGLPELERRNGKIGREFLEAEDDWAKTSFCSRQSVGKNLQKLAVHGLIRYEPGNNGKTEGSSRKLTKVRRCSLEELKSPENHDASYRFIPAELERIAERLEIHGVPWHKEIITPRWTVGITGRFTHSNSKLTKRGTNTKDARLKAFLGALKPNEILYEIDWSSAEPTVLIDALKKRALLPPEFLFDDIYELIQKSRGLTRSKAKVVFNKVLTYGTQTKIRVPPDWPQDERLITLATAIDTYRNELFEKGKRTGSTRRHTHTLLGRRMQVPPHVRSHRGLILSWHIQGTVADLFGRVVEQFLDDEAKGLCRFFFPCHDAVYLAVEQGRAYNPSEVMTRIPEALGIGLRVREERYERTSAGEGRPKRRALVKG